MLIKAGPLWNNLNTTVNPPVSAKIKLENSLYVPMCEQEGGGIRHRDGKKK